MKSTFPHLARRNVSGHFAKSLALSADGQGLCVLALQQITIISNYPHGDTCNEETKARIDEPVGDILVNRSDR